MLRAAQSRLHPRTLQRALRSRPSLESPYLSFLYPACCESRLFVRGEATMTKTRKPRRIQLKPAEKVAELKFSKEIQFPMMNDRWIDSKVPPRHGKSNEKAHSKLIILDQPERTPPDPERRAKKNNPRDNQQLLATFEACISVGRIARAQLMLNEVTRTFGTSSALVVGAHNTYMNALYKRAVAEKDNGGLESIFDWYTGTMSKKFEIEPDATTIAVLLKAGLKLDKKLEGQRYIKQYTAEWINKFDNINEVFMCGVLEPEELINVARICGLKPKEIPEEYRDLYLQQEPAAEPQITKIPEPISQKVKGFSLASVKQSLRSLIDPDAMPSPVAFGDQDLAFQTARQKLLEDDAYFSAQEVWRKDHEAMSALGIPMISENVNVMLWQWHQAMVPIIYQELDRVEFAENNPGTPNTFDRLMYGPFLRLMTPEKVAAIVILEMIKLHNSAGHVSAIRSSLAVNNIGMILEQEYYAQEITKKKNSDMKTLPKEKAEELFNNPKLFRMSLRNAHGRLSESANQDPSGNTLNMMIKWPGAVKAKLGANLITMLIHCAKVPIRRKDSQTGEYKSQSHPAIHHTYEFMRGKRIGVLKLHPELMKRLAAEPLRRGVLGRLLPMLVPPRPWLSHDEGAYFYTQSRVMRTKQSKEQEIYVQTASKRGDLEQIFEGLDVLGQTAWKINRPIFDVILEVWNKGDAFADIPARDSNAEMPREPPPDSSTTERQEWIRAMREFKASESNAHSQRCDVNLKIEIARAFLFERFYFPHNVDFRGRAYPIPPHLNHLGNDLSRGLLMFDKGKELGESGLRWLKIHLANIAGYDKASFTEREQFVNDHLEDIFDSADNPLGGKQWWLQSEDPWQCLSASMAIRDALKMGDPTKYVCYLPVAQDGTCNGLQHYAALGGDMAGAKQVNLEPSDRPQDVYTGVAQLVAAEVAKDAKTGHELAELLDGKISRKIVKQSVMTNVYGVTFMGARAQIQSKLKEIEEIPKNQQMVAASYLARLVFKSISDLFSGATEIQRWLANSARIISRSAGPTQYQKIEEEVQKPVNEQRRIDLMTSVVWTTPLGMPIVQPYRQPRMNIVQTNLQKITIVDPTAVDQVNSRKQMTAFPPNFIHSLDATHMLLSAMKCAEHGLTFASVHDSFWTHPSDVDKLNRILRDAFIDLHSEDIMTKLKSEFETRYEGHKYIVQIDKSTPVGVAIAEVRKERCRYLNEKYPKRGGRMKNITSIEELHWELERDRLVNSQDAAERERGEKMVTPSVLVRRAGDIQKVELTIKLEGALGEADTNAKNNLGKHSATDVFEDDAVSAAVDDDFENEDVELEDESEKVKDEGEDDEVEKGETEGEDAEEDAEDEAEDEAEEQVEVVAPKKPKKRYASQISSYDVWMPLEFPPLPPKGEFDVVRLKGSKYFFS